jgi:ribonuclease III
MSSSPSTRDTNTPDATADARLQAALGYRFSDATLLAQALTHKSFARHHNERLEFLGDAVLGYVVANRLFEQQPEAHEDTLSLLRASLVRKETLAEVATELELGRYLRLGVGERRSGGHHRASILADALEAVIGAVHLDGGIEASRTLILKLFEPRMQHLDADVLKDAKTRLQEALQGANCDLPEYEIQGTRGSAHAKTFKVSCRVDTFGLMVTAEGRSRRAAEKHAAELMLEQITPRLQARDV